MAALMTTYQENEPAIRGATFFSDTYQGGSLITALGLDWYGDILSRWATDKVGVGQNPVIPSEMARKWFAELWAQTHQRPGSLARILNWPPEALTHSSEDSLNDRLCDLLSFLWVSIQTGRQIEVSL